MTRIVSVDECGNRVWMQQCGDYVVKI